MTHITLIRHGTTEWIEAGRLHGVSDSPLSARGRREAQLAADALRAKHFDAFYTSSLGRARETAAIIGEAIMLEAVPHDGLQEMNFGWLEGGPNFNLAKDPPLVRPFHAAWIGFASRISGEGRPVFGKRVESAVREIVARHPDQRVAIVIHMAVRSMILSHLVDRNPMAWVNYDGWPACAFTELEILPDGSAKLLNLSIADHLVSETSAA